MKTEENIFGNEYFQRTVDALPTAIYTSDAEGFLTYLNTAAVKLSGRKPKLGVDRWCVSSKLFYPDGTSMPAEECPMAVALKEEHSITGREGIIEQPDGDRFRFEAYSSPLYDDGGDIFGSITMLIDITERKKAQEEREEVLQKVKKEQQLLSNIFQHAPSYMSMVKGPDHVYERANEMYYKLVEYRDIIGKPLLEALPELEGHEIPELLDRVYETGEPHTGKVKQLKVWSDRESPPEERYVYSVYQPYRDAEGNVTGIFIQGVDMTQRIEAEKRLQTINETLEERVQERTKSLMSYQNQLRSLASQLSKAEEMQRQRLAGELHDNLGQMLAVSKMKINMLGKSNFSKKEASQIEDLSELIDDALSYTRELMSDLKPPPTLDKEDVTASIEWVADKMKKHDLQVITEDDGRVKPVNDEIRAVLVQCVRELLFNIIKHAGVDEALVKMSRTDATVKVVVEDRGKGFDPEGDVTSSLGGGFGLFNISERIKLLGGSINIESQRGTGTTVILRAPLLEKGHHEQIPADKESNVSPVTIPKQDTIKVMLVDDHKMMREGLRKIVNDQDDMNVVAEASDGEEAIKLAQEYSPDIIVMDVNMPVMDGIEATREIMAQGTGQRVIALSLHDHKNVIESMRKAGATAYLTKNEAFETLGATIRSEVRVSRT